MFRALGSWGLWDFNIFVESLGAGKGLGFRIRFGGGGFWFRGFWFKSGAEGLSWSWHRSPRVPGAAGGGFFL